MLAALAAERLGNGDTTGCDWHSKSVTDADLWAVRGRMRGRLMEETP